MTETLDKTITQERAVEALREVVRLNPGRSNPRCQHWADVTDGDLPEGTPICLIGQAMHVLGITREDTMFEFDREDGGPRPAGFANQTLQAALAEHGWTLTDEALRVWTIGQHKADSWRDLDGSGYTPWADAVAHVEAHLADL